MFYVYTLTDPRDGAVFYVGKGSGRRIEAHEAEARKGGHSRKCDRIRDIWSSGADVQRNVVSKHEDENEALQAEFDLIEAIGLENLTNVVPGGLIGAEAYLARKADLERRKAEAGERVLRKGFYDLAPRFAAAIRAKQETGGFGAYAGGRWIEFSDAVEAMFRGMVNLVGFDEAKRVMAPYGVNLVRG